MIKAPRQIIHNLEKEKYNIYLSASKDIDDIKKKQLIQLLNDLVFMPAYNHPQVTPILKEKIEHSWKHLEDCKTSRDVEDFYWNAQNRNKSGDEAYSEIRKLKNIDSFEDIRKQFMDACGY